MVVGWWEMIGSWVAMMTGGLMVVRVSGWQWLMIVGLLVDDY